MAVVLLVEDNADDELLIRRLLKKNDIASDIVVVRDGAQALEFLFGAENASDHALQALPLLVLLDLNLPKVHGFDVLKQIRAHERTHNLPVILLTANSEKKDIIVGYGLGATSYIRKPVDNVEFDAAVRQLGRCMKALHH